MTTPILLVEDDPDAQELLVALCGHAGYPVDVASDGFQALRLFISRRHAVVLVDYHLPEMDGYALARLIHEIRGSGRRGRLVGITADARGLASRRGADALFDAIVVKPIVPETLFSILERLTRTEPAEAETPADILWRRRGLPRRPRAILCPGAGRTETEAVAQVFALVADHEPCDLVLVAAEAGLTHLQALRAEGPARLVPSVDLTGRLGDACDLHFRVNDPASWSALAGLCSDFASRRVGLSPEARAATDAAGRFRAPLHVAGRDLILREDPTGSPVYETGHAPSERLIEPPALPRTGFPPGEATENGAVARPTETGSRSLGVAEARDGTPSAPASFVETPVANHRTMEELSSLVGAATISRLQDRLIHQAAQAFAPDASRSEIAREAHLLVSAAGALGFERLSLACRALDTAAARGDAIETHLVAAKAACAEVQAWRP